MNAKLLGSIILLLNLLKCSTGLSQVYVDGIAIDTVETPFIQLISSNGGNSNRTNIIVDDGQRSVSIAFSRQRIAGPDQQPINFRSTIEALNFFVKQGWELAFFESGSANIYVYLLRRKSRSSQ